MERRTFMALIVGGILAAPFSAVAQEVVYYEEIGRASCRERVYVLV